MSSRTVSSPPGSTKDAGKQKINKKWREQKKEGDFVFSSRESLVPSLESFRNPAQTTWITTRVGGWLGSSKLCQRKWTVQYWNVTSACFFFLTPTPHFAYIFSLVIIRRPRHIFFLLRKTTWTASRVGPRLSPPFSEIDVYAYLSRLPRHPFVSIYNDTTTIHFGI